MKRKRGNKKKGKLKAPAPSLPTLETDEAVVNLISLRSSEVDNDNDIGNSNDDGDDDMNEEINTPSSTGTEQPVHLANINPDGSIDKKPTAGKSVGRVKVKLKASSSSKSWSDTDKSSTAQLGLERKGAVVTNKMVDGEAGAVGSGNVSKKPESIKIKSSLKLVSGEKSGRLVTVGQDESLQRKEVRRSQQKHQYDKQELDTALMVIKKVMKMDAAEPFNLPVNPEALGIPDYFDVIDTPMDFGTICTNLEKGNKYLNSEDVYKDVKYIWDNCYKYNNKGDYVLDLMKRVKKNFMKYWTGAGLFTEEIRAANDAEGSHGDDVVASNPEHPSSKSKKTKKRHGRRHKSDCLCAICVLKRRRKEREESERRAQGHTGFVDNRLTLQFKNEEPTPVESTGGEESSSIMGESLDPDTDGEVEVRNLDTKSVVIEAQCSPMVEKQEEDEGEEEEEEQEEDEEEDEEGNEMEIQKQEARAIPEQSQGSDRAREGSNQQSQYGKSQDPNVVDQVHTQKEHMLVEPEEETITVLQNKRKLQELQERQQKAKIFKKFHIENPLLLSLCGTLFPDNHKSVWSGPHSLAHHHQGPSPAPRRSCSIQAAIETWMK